VVGVAVPYADNARSLGRWPTGGTSTVASRVRQHVQLLAGACVGAGASAGQEATRGLALQAEPVRSAAIPEATDGQSAYVASCPWILLGCLSAGSAATVAIGCCGYVSSRKS
jgi:hypothetical protein